jgi:hypothetical protein
MGLYGVAKLGGFTDTKRTGIAGWATLWVLQERVQGDYGERNTAG